MQLSLPLIAPAWPLVVVYPLSVAFFWTAYLRLLEPLCQRWMPEQYAAFSDFNARCFRQNLLSGLHTLLSSVCLSAALLADGSDLVFADDARLYPHRSFLLYLDIAMSFGYFSYALPTSVVMAQAGFPFGSNLMVVHHALVAVAQSTFLLTRCPAGFMAASGFLFELTNVAFIPHIILLQLNADLPRTRTLIGLVLVVLYTLARCVACTLLALVSVADVAAFAPALPARWPFALLGLTCFWGLLLISWYWYVASILPALHEGLQAALGAEYYHACCPRAIRTLIWRRATSEGRRSASEARLRFKALQELRSEMETAAPA